MICLRECQKLPSASFGRVLNPEGKNQGEGGDCPESRRLACEKKGRVVDRDLSEVDEKKSPAIS